mmetsp:Transcript_9958/g.21512  ORF Transcript_9958/g.21512 Transcript_9958/m.21512 type:complete len:154 (+) Transcript_9958:203-664(+)
MLQHQPWNGQPAVAIPAEGTLFATFTRAAYLYFADSTCRNCPRFGPLLARFVFGADDRCSGGATNRTQGGNDLDCCDENGCRKEISDMSGSSSAASSNLVPGCCSMHMCANDTTDKRDALVLCDDMGVYCLSFDHDNRLAIIRDSYQCSEYQQ